MPGTPTYPGVYIEELPSGVRTLIGVGTSITAFVGSASRGTVNVPTHCFSFGDYERYFGGLDVNSMMSYAVYQYFLNGGSDALIVRVAGSSAVKTSKSLAAGTGTVVISAANVGTWANSLYISVDHVTSNTADTNLFNLNIKEKNAAGAVVNQETFLNVSVDSSSARFVDTVLLNGSSLVRSVTTSPTASPADATDVQMSTGTAGTDVAPTSSEIEGTQSGKTGIYALEKADLFNMLCIPPITRGGDTALTTWQKALAYCKTRRAMLIVDSPAGWTDLSTNSSGVFNTSTGIDGTTTGFSSLRDENAAIYFPRIIVADSLRGGVLDTFVPCGAVAGTIARTDSGRGVWKAPAGIDARLAGVSGVALKLTDSEQGQLNPVGINVIRNLPVAGNVIWGARTLEGADRLASDWKYLPVRRLALFLEESLYRGTQWVVFEPNDESLWAQIRLNVGAFMHQLFRQGAFQGAKPSESYFVMCDSSTTTQNDINQGVVNIVVGFAPLKPAEFVIIKLQQIAGQIVS